MNTQMLLVVVTFVTATTLAFAANVPNPNPQSNATPQLSAAPGPAARALLGEPGSVGQPGDSDDLDKAEFFYGGWGGGLGFGFGNYGWNRRYYGGYPYGGYYGSYRPSYYNYGGYGW